MPGLAASSTIFDFIKLDDSKYKIHLLEWIIPLSKNESLTNYAQRMCELITKTNFVLVGVSFGGILVQEMSKYCNPLKVIIISSVKHQDEFPNRLKFLKNTNTYKLVPVNAIANIESFAKFAFGDTIKNRIDLYKKYLSVRDKTYLTWAIYHVLHWKQTQDYSAFYHIHGDNDDVFPIKNIKNCSIIENGTHAMVIYKAKKINKQLENILTK